MKEVHTSSLDAAASAAASKVTYAGAGASVFGWLASSEAVAIVGILAAIIGLAVNFYFKRREDKRQQELHAAQMRALRGDYL